MARKDVFGSVMSQPSTKGPDVTPVFIGRSASRSIMQSFEDLSKLAVVELAPELVDASFVSDRLEDDGGEYQELLNAIRANGQDTPILVRPHPSTPGRYQTVFGHRRLKVARELGRPVRAIVKVIPDREHVIAQGQENAARSNLSFIERTLFAKQVLEQGQSTETLMSALGVDETTLSKMRSVLAHVPEQIIRTIGPAKNIGRDRWWLFSKLLERLVENGSEPSFQDLMAVEATSEERFEVALGAVSKAGSQTTKRAKPRSVSRKTWSAKDKTVSVTLQSSDKKAIVTLKAKDGPQFAEFITDRLELLYEEFRQPQTRSTGD